MVFQALFVQHPQSRSELCSRDGLPFCHWNRGAFISLIPLPKQNAASRILHKGPFQEGLKPRLFRSNSP